MIVTAYSAFGNDLFLSAEINMALENTLPTFLNCPYNKKLDLLIQRTTHYLATMNSNRGLYW